MNIARKYTVYRQNIIDYHLTDEGQLHYRDRVDVTPGHARLADATAWTAMLLSSEVMRYARQPGQEGLKIINKLFSYFELYPKIFGMPLLGRCIHVRQNGEWPAGARKDRKYFEGKGEYAKYVIAADVSPDQYSYFMQAMALVYCYIPSLRSRVVHLVIPMLEKIERDGFNIFDFDGEQTKHGDLRTWFGPVPITFYAYLKYAFYYFGNIIAPGKFEHTLKKWRWHGYNYLLARPRLGGRMSKESNVIYLITNMFTLWLCAYKTNDVKLLTQIEKGARFAWSRIGRRGNAPVNFILGHIGLTGDTQQEAFKQGVQTLVDFPENKRWYENVIDEKERREVVPIGKRKKNTVYWKGDHYLEEIRADNKLCRKEKEYTGVDFLYAVELEKALGEGRYKI